jgi:hypothetical protein
MSRREDMGRDSDSRLSRRLIRCNFVKPARGPRARAASERLGIVASINKLVAHRLTSAVAALYEAHLAGIEDVQTSNLSTIQALALYSRWPASLHRT